MLKNLFNQIVVVVYVYIVSIIVVISPLNGFLRFLHIEFTAYYPLFVFCSCIYSKSIKYSTTNPLIIPTP